MDADGRLRPGRPAEPGEYRSPIPGSSDRARAEYDALLEEDLRDPVVRHSRAILELRMGQPAPGRPRPVRAAGPVRSRRRRIGSNTWPSARRPGCCWAGRPRPWPTPAKPAASSAARPTIAWRSARCSRRGDTTSSSSIARRTSRCCRCAAPASTPTCGPRPPPWSRSPRGRDGTAFRAGLTRAAILAALGESREALTAANRAASLSPFSAEARLVRARVLLAAGDRAAAQAEVDWNLGRSNRDHPGLIELGGYLKLAAGDAARGLADFDRALSLGSRDGIHLGKASALLALGNAREALDEWSLALRRDPELPEAFLGRARTYFLLREWDLGLADLEQAAAWAHADARIEAAVALSYLECLP